MKYKVKTIKYFITIPKDLSVVNSKVIALVFLLNLITKKKVF